MPSSATAEGRFPDIVPVLVDPLRQVILRPHVEADLADIVEQCKDPDTIRYTTIPVPYEMSDAVGFWEAAKAGWESSGPLIWAVECESDGRRQFGGSIDLRLLGDGTAEVGFGLHPRARGKGVMSAALRLVRDYGLDVLALRVIRWRAVVGNWGSRRVAAAAGFQFDGSVRKLLNHRGELLDGWLATITADDPRGPRNWQDPPVLPGPGFVLRSFRADDVDRIVEACRDERTRHWVMSFPQPYERAHARAFVAWSQELAAEGHGYSWCIADAGDDRCLGWLSLEGFNGYARRAEIGYWTHPDARGKGLMTSAVRCVTSYVEQLRLVSSIHIRCAVGNRASRRVAEAAGYGEIGTMSAAEPLGDGSVVDLVIYARP